MSASRNIAAFKTSGKLKIYINEILHLLIISKNLNGIHSWYDVINKNKIYSIEISFKNGNTILMEYVDFKNWKSILKLLNENL